MNFETDREKFPFEFLHAGSAAADARTSVFERSDYGECTVEFVTHGKGVLEENGRRFEIGANSVYFLHKHSLHRYWGDREDPWRKLFFVVDGEMMEYLLRVYRLDAVYVMPEVPQLRSWFEAMLALSPGGDGIDFKAAVLFHRFAEDCRRILYEPVIHAGAEVIALKKHLEHRLYDRFRLEAYSAAAGFSTAYLIRGFQKAFGCSPYDYLLTQRIEAARRMLAYTTLSVKEIAAKLEFSDQYYFSTYFKRRTGMSPSACRREGLFSAPDDAAPKSLE